MALTNYTNSLFPNSTGTNGANSYGTNTYNGLTNENNYSLQSKQSRMFIASVQSESEVQNYPVAPGNTVLLISFNSNQFWLKSTNQNGVPEQIRVFSFEETTPKPVVMQNNSDYVTKKEFDDLKSYLDSQFMDMKNQFAKRETYSTNYNHTNKKNKEDSK